MKVISALERLRQGNHIQGQPTLYSRNLFQNKTKTKEKWGWQDSSVVKDTAALAEDLGSVPSTHTAAPDHLGVQFQEIQSPLQASVGGRYGCDAQTQTQANTQIHTTKTQLGKGTDRVVQWVGHLPPGLMN